MGIELAYEHSRPGLFADQIGEVKLTINSLESKLSPLTMNERGSLLGIDIFMDSTGGKFFNYYNDTFKPKLIKRLQSSFGEEVKINFRDDHGPMPISPTSKAETLLITATLRFEKITCLQADVLIERGGLGKDIDYIEKLVS